MVERLLSISGEDTISVQRKYLVDWDGRLPTRIMITDQRDPGTDRRFRGRWPVACSGLIFPNSFFGTRGPALEGKLKTELPGILNWAIEGYRRLKPARTFRPAEECRRRTSNKSKCWDHPVKAFLRDRCVVGPGFTVAIEGLYGMRWKAWSAHNGNNDRSAPRSGLAAICVRRCRA